MNKRTKQLQISPRTKQLVWLRQNGRSIYSGAPITVEQCCCHYVSRARSGLGIEENIVGLTNEEHSIFDLNIPGDHKAEQEKMRNKAREHLEKSYPGWCEEICKYKKWYERRD